MKRRPLPRRFPGEEGPDQLDALLTLFDYDFMRRALLAVLLIMLPVSLLGTLVVNNGMAFSPTPWAILP